MFSMIFCHPIESFARDGHFIFEIAELAGGVRNLHQLSEVTSSGNFPRKIKSRAKQILRGENSSELVKPRTAWFISLFLEIPFLIKAQELLFYCFRTMDSRACSDPDSKECWFKKSAKLTAGPARERGMERKCRSASPITPPTTSADQYISSLM